MNRVYAYSCNYIHSSRNLVMGGGGGGGGKTRVKE